MPQTSARRCHPHLAWQKLPAPGWDVLQPVQVPLGMPASNLDCLLSPDSASNSSFSPVRTLEATDAWFLPPTHPCANPGWRSKLLTQSCPTWAVCFKHLAGCETATRSLFLSTFQIETKKEKSKTQPPQGSFPCCSSSRHDIVGFGEPNPGGHLSLPLYPPHLTGQA